MGENNKRGLGRRQYLKAVGATAVGGALAGCTSGEFGARTTEATDQTSEAKDQPIDVKAMVFTHFEVGKNSGDTPGEIQKWYTGYDLTNKVEVPGAWAPCFTTMTGLPPR